MNNRISCFWPLFEKTGQKLLSSLLVVLTLAIADGKAQTISSPQVYRNLALEGGGIRGIAYGGALAELEKRGVLDSIQRVSGTSAGSIQACLLAMGYSPQEITDITFKTPVQQFNDGRFFFIGGFNRLAKRYGWYRGDKFTNWLATLIETKTGNPNLTFEQLHALAGKNGYRDLYITGTNLSRQRTEIFCHENYPQMRVKDAVRISMSVPFYFQAVLMDSLGQVHQKPLPNGGTDVMIDGGLLANFPLMVFDHQRYVQPATSVPASNKTTVPRNEKRFINSETLGIRLDHDDQILYDTERKGLAPHQINGMKEYMNAFYRIIIENLNRHELTPADWDRTISVSTAGFGPKVKRLSEKEKERLLESGRMGVTQYFAGCE